MDDGFCYQIIIVAVFLIFLILNNGKQKRKRIAEARKAYQDSLTKLKRDPTNMDLRQRVLEIGRQYVRIASDGGQGTVFDEVSLLNDMNAIAGSEVSKPDHKTQIPNDDISARLKTLENLKAQGLIADDEYEKRRSAILDSI